jgi:hypothetical protein
MADTITATRVDEAATASGAQSADDGPIAPARGALGRALRPAGILAAVVLVLLGAAAVARGVEGRSTVRTALALEGVSGQPQMTPAAIAAKAREGGLTGIDLPTCSVAGAPIDDGASARCFAEYMRIDALIGAGGRTYAQMPRFATADGKGTSDEALAQKTPAGEPMSNPARQVWVTATALSNALNTSYMAEQVSLFGIAVGAGFLLLGLITGSVALSGMRIAPRGAG